MQMQMQIQMQSPCPALSLVDTTAVVSPVRSASLPAFRGRRPLPSSLSCKGSLGGMPISPVKGSKLRRVVAVRAYNGSQDNSDASVPLAPLQPESAVGQFLAQLLKSHPHLVTAAVEQQLDKLIESRETLKEESQPSSSGTDLVLYRRIAELKAQERQKSLEEIIYALIVQRFVEAGITMIPEIPSSSNDLKVDSWLPQDKELESIHSPEALEMIREHMMLVLGGRGDPEVAGQNIIAQIGKVRVGQVYAASIMYGYFLRRVDKRFQLEKSMKMLNPASNEAIDAEQVGESENKRDETAAEFAAAVEAMTKGLKTSGWNNVVKPNTLRAYVMSFDNETLSRCATLRAKESLNVVEKHAEALFGRPELQIRPDGSVSIVKDEVIKLSFSGLRKLVLEAVAFGTFLWDVESYVDSRYSFALH